MLSARCVIANVAGGHYERHGWLVDAPRLDMATGRLSPKRCVRLGRWTPPRKQYASVRSAVRSIDCLARRLAVRVKRISLATYAYDDAGQRTSAEWRVLR